MRHLTPEETSSHTRAKALSERSKAKILVSFLPPRNSRSLLRRWFLVLTCPYSLCRSEWKFSVD